MICVRGQCAPPELGKALEKRLLALIAEHGMDNPDHSHYTTCTLTNCLAVCENGPAQFNTAEKPRSRSLNWKALLPGRGLKVPVEFGAPIAVDRGKYAEGTSALRAGVERMFLAMRRSAS